MWYYFSEKNTYPYSKMVELRGDKCVCDLTLIMRSRLLCGLYSRRAVPPRWRGLAKVYCLAMGITTIYVTYSLQGNFDTLWLLHWMPEIGQYLLAFIISLWTEDEYIYEFFTRNEMTDVTLDSSLVFKKFQEQIRNAYKITSLLYVMHIGLAGAAIIYNFDIVYFNTFLIKYISTSVLELFVSQSYTPKLLVMGLFNTRMLVLRRRLERYGFRTIAHATPQPYCQIYDEIWQGLYAVDKSLKIMLFFDLIFNSCKLIVFITFYIYSFSWKEYAMAQATAAMLYIATKLSLRLILFFGHVALLESAAVHCESMAVFTVTQLIKTPNAEERRRMYALLCALEQRGARYRVLRALPIDARLVLSVLGFCSAHVLIFINTIKGK